MSSLQISVRHGNLRASARNVRFISAECKFYIYLVDAQAFGPTCFAVLLFAAIHSGKVLQLCRRIRANRLCTLLPIRRTHFSMFILFSNVNTHPPHVSNLKKTHGKLECLYETQRLVDRASNRQIIHGDLSQHALRIDQITRAKCYPLFGDQTSIVARHAHIPVCQERDAKIGSEASCRAGLFRPGVVGVFRVGRDGCPTTTTTKKSRVRQSHRKWRGKSR